MSQSENEMKSFSYGNANRQIEEIKANDASDSDNRQSYIYLNTHDNSFTESLKEILNLEFFIRNWDVSHMFGGNFEECKFVFLKLKIEKIVIESISRLFL